MCNIKTCLRLVTFHKSLLRDLSTLIFRSVLCYTFASNNFTPTSLVVGTVIERIFGRCQFESWLHERQYLPRFYLVLLPVMHSPITNLYPASPRSLQILSVYRS